jgi:Tol biopolymer transport system component/imidazolonepropionase-like amidohydrolase
MRLIILLFLLFNVLTTYAQVADSIKVSIHEGTNIAVAVSPDKKTIAFDLQGTLFVMPFTGGTATAITDNLGDCRQPSWSPDGNTLVFQSYRDGGWHLWTINKDGKHLKQITFGIYDDREPQWSADGKKILFASDRNNNYDIWEMDLETQSFRALTSNPKNDFNPTYSPDGKTIAFASDRGTKPGIYTLDEQGKETKIADGLISVATPSWSPDAKQILFYASDNIETKLFITNLTSGATAQWSDSKEDAFPFRATWLSQNEVLYTADGQIKIKNISKKKTTSLKWEATVYLHRPAYKRKQYDFDADKSIAVKGIMGPVVSPDGKHIAFSALGNLWLLNIGNPTPVQITDNAYVNMHPSWSPDGKEIVFVSDRDGSMDLWIYNLESGKVRQLTSTQQNEIYPSWSPDGSFIAFLQSEGNSLLNGSTIQSIHVQSKQITKVHDAITTPSQPSWSPDGRRVMVSAMTPFSSKYREGLNKVLVISLNGEADRWIEPVEGRTLATRSKNGPVWSPDGRKVAFIHDGVLWYLPVTTEGKIAGPVQRLTNVLSDNPSWTADSKQIVFLSAEKLMRVDLQDGIQSSIPFELNWKPAQPAASRKIVHAGKLFDGVKNAYQSNVDIVLEGNRIKEIIPHQSHGNLEVIDASAETVIPGMFDMHAHQSEAEGEKTGRGWLAFGITSVREPGADPYDAAARKEIWSSGVRPGPREFFTGFLQDGSRVYYNLANSNSAASSELELQRAKALDYDFMKTYVRFPDYLQKRFTQFSHQLGIPVSSHEIYPAVSYGVDAIEHVGATSRRGYSPVRSNIGRSYQDVTELITAARLKVTPTAALYGGFNMLTATDPQLLRNKQYMALYSELYRTTYEGYVKSMQADLASEKAMLEGWTITFKKLLAAGNHFTAGTDAPFMPYGLSIQIEIQTYVEVLGMSPFTALQSATIWAAESVGVDKELGSLEAGKLADLVIVSGDPLSNIKDALNVKTVIKNGFVFPVDELLAKPTVK